MDYFDTHSWPILMLFGYAWFPRITLWFFSAITGGFGFWVGVFFFPHVMVAFWATVYYWDTNPILCVIAWFVALAGTGGEGERATKRLR